MIDLGYCIWFKLCKDHEINDMIRNLSKKFHTPSFEAHISVEYGIRTLPTARALFEAYKKKEKPSFCIQRTPRVAKMNRAYTIQLDCLQKDEQSGMLWHITTASRLDRPFYYDEVSLVKPKTFLLHPKDYELVLMDCSHKDPGKWHTVEL